MSEPFESCREKVERAEHHVEDLKVEVKRFFDRQPYLVVHYDEPNTGDKMYRVHVREDPPSHLGPIVGDVLYNLRSGLEHIAYQIVIDGGGTPDEKTGFPIGKHRKAFESQLGKVAGAGKQSIRLLRSHKPYSGGNKLLWWLHHLNIVDKHRFPLLVGSAYRSFTLPYKATMRRLGARLPDDVEFPDLALKPADRLFPLKDGDDVFRIMKAARDPEGEEDPKFTFEIAFGEPEVVNGEPLLDTLDQLISVVESVRESFVTLYAQQGAPKRP